MAKAKKRAKFFCESCGAETDAGSNRCRKCGSRFYGVQCPKCGYSGPEALFLEGCPSCGYLAPQIGKERPAGTGPVPESPAAKESGLNLPGWFYPVTISVLLLILLLLFSVFTRL
jgi:predicted RNA-binding Zn-ribbon protein involved in translation (DUF1610 family)